MTTDKRRASSPLTLPSPSTISFPAPNNSNLASISSPSRFHAPRNEHPYAFKSTSSAVLTRSNSIGNNSRHTHHSYTPPPPPSPGLGRSPSVGHRHTKSLSNAALPMPLPIPPSPSPNVNDGNNPSPYRIKRRDTLPSFSPSTQTLNEAKISDLPDNPKLWTPSQLSLYLTSSLRFRRGGAIPQPVAKDIAAWVLREKLGGKRFLRLTETHLTEMGINQLWREALLDASRILRKKVLQGRIWGFNATSMNNGEVQQPPSPSKPQKSRHSRIPTTVDEGAEPEATDEQPMAPPPGGYRRGRVRSMVESLERSGSSASGSDRGNSPTEDLSPEQDEKIKAELKAAGLWFDESDDEVDGGFASDEISTSSSASEGEDALQRKHNYVVMPNGQTEKEDTEPTIEELLAQDGQNVSGDENTVGVTIKRNVRGKWEIGDGSTKSERPSFGAWAWERADEGVIGGTAKKVEHVAPTASMHPLQISSSTSMPLSDVFAPTNEPEEHKAWEVIQSLKERLEAVERRMVDIEKNEKERNKELAQLRAEKQQWLRERQAYVAKLREHDSRPQSSLAAADTDRDFHTANESEDNDTEIEHTSRRAGLVALVPSILTTHVPVPRIFSSSSTPTGTVVRRRKNGPTVDAVGQPGISKHEDVDPEPADLPSYVLLVSLGVCAVVLRVIFRKVTGNNRRS